MDSQFLGRAYEAMWQGFIQSDVRISAKNQSEKFRVHARDMETWRNHTRLLSETGTRIPLSYSTMRWLSTRSIEYIRKRCYIASSFDILTLISYIFPFSEYKRENKITSRDDRVECPPEFESRLVQPAVPKIPTLLIFQTFRNIICSRKTMEKSIPSSALVSFS